MTSDERSKLYREGMATRRAVLGEEHVERATRSTSSFTEPFQAYITRSAWGEIWSRDGIDRRMRSAITLTALLAVNRMEEFELHVHAAVRNGLTARELQEVILNSAIYCGVPAANQGFEIAARVLGELGLVVD